MSNGIFEPVIKELKDSLHPLQQQLNAWGDSRSAKLIGDLLSKEAAGEMTIALCGHFSAGKSSLINSLCGKKVLPSGPVPTSANVVSIRNGEPHALIYPALSDANEQMNSTPKEVSLDELYTYCTNGGDYASVEVWDDVPLLGSHGVLMDTPGVDSTDDGHQKATHSALHLADAVLYVMDYNHVQSENNLVFAKSLSDWGKPLYLIVNQIDKHRDRELSFSKYREEVEAAFKRWQVDYESLLFTSLKVEDHPYNQWQSLQQLIKDLIAQRKPLLSYSISCSAHHIAEQSLESYQESLQDEKNALLEEMGGEEQAAKVEAQTSQMQSELLRLEQLTATERDQMRREVDSLLDNSSLTPADLREIARLFLESRKPKFKMGLLFAGNKTEQEKQDRLDKFVKGLREQASAQIVWYLQQLLRGFGEQQGIWNESFQQELEAATPEIEVKLILDSVQPEATLSGEYVLNYCRTLSAEVKAMYRRAALDFAEHMLAAIAVLAAEEAQRVQQELSALHEQSAAITCYASLQRGIAERAAATQELLPPRLELSRGALPAVSALDRPAAQQDGNDAGAAHSAPAVAPRRSGAGPQGGAAGGRRQRLESAAAQLESAAELLRRYPALGAAARGLSSRAEALAGGSFTMALFGAFSAGKSSFANALLGEDVLPVSPHPTTAAINRILAPQGDFKHGTAQVKLKTLEALQDDLDYSFSVLHLGKATTDGWRQIASSLSPEGIHPAGLPHFGFLKAAASGWEQIQAQLGATITADLQEYRSFVADESRSCFVESIDLYYSCELTEQGIVLVDTPGADSLHARHTGVTFQYMKHADAIVFVTYYNHAFSKGDRQFLTQLGRVKDSFALDKMFFIVNASDLASSEEELEQVVKHVDGNLRTRGIRLPHIYPLSSMNALEAKISGDEERYQSSGFATFEKALGEFAGEELPRLSLQAAIQDIAAARKRAQEWSALAKQDEGARQQRIQQLRETKEIAAQRIQTFGTLDLSRDMVQEIQELLFHVRQRIGFNLGEFFLETFHPSVLREDAGQLKQVFVDCGRELERTLVRELDQELWATTLRLENKGKALVHTAAVHAVQDIQDRDAVLLLTVPEEKSWSSPDWGDLQMDAFIDWSSFWSFFKSPKNFFEGSGRDKLRQTVDPLIKEVLGAAAEEKQQQLINFYCSLAAGAQERQASTMQEQLGDMLHSMLQMLESPEDIESWDVLAKELMTIEKNIN